jgi:hypothetical protein
MLYIENSSRQLYKIASTTPSAMQPPYNSDQKTYNRTYHDTPSHLTLKVYFQRLVSKRSKNCFVLGIVTWEDDFAGRIQLLLQRPGPFEQSEIIIPLVINTFVTRIMHWIPGTVGNVRIILYFQFQLLPVHGPARNFCRLLTDTFL